MRRAFLAAVAVVSSSLLAEAQAAGAPTALRIGYAPGGGSVLTFIAKDKGFFKQEGIDADLVPFNSSADGLNALLAGKIDIGVSFGTGGPLTFIAKGADFVIIGGHLSGGHPVITKPENAARFKSIADFRGKTVATPRLYTADIVWRGALIRAGIDPQKDLTIIDMKKPQDVLEAVKSGKVDIGIASSAVYLQAKSAGLAIPFWSNDFLANHPCCRIVTAGKNLSDRPALAKSFLKAIIRAERVLKESPEVAVDVNKRFLELDDAQARDFTLEPHQIVEADPNAKAVKIFWKDMNTIGYIASSIDIGAHIATAPYWNALEELKAKDPSPFYDRLERRFKERN